MHVLNQPALRPLEHNHKMCTANMRRISATHLGSSLEGVATRQRTSSVGAGSSSPRPRATRCGRGHPARSHRQQRQASFDHDGVYFTGNEVGSPGNDLRVILYWGSWGVPCLTSKLPLPSRIGPWGKLSPAAILFAGRRKVASPGQLHARPRPIPNEVPRPRRRG